MSKLITRIEIGKIISKRKIFSYEEVLNFIKISGDNNPIHHDKEYAKTTLFKKPICHGILVASIFSNLLGTTFTGSIYMNQSLSFLAPVFIEEEVEGFIEIKELDKVKKYLYLKTYVKKINDNNKLAIDGEAKIKLINMNDYL